MSTNFQMDPIIRRIDRSEKHEAAIDGIVVEASVAGGWFSEKWFYCVTRPQAHSGWANIRIDRDIDAPERDWRLPLQISLALQFAGHTEADARRLVDLVREAPNPDRAVEILINRWIGGFMGDRNVTPAQFIESFGRFREPLKAHIVKVAKDEALLQVMSAEILIRGEAEAKEVLEIRAPKMPVVLRDYKPDLELSLDLDLRLAPGSVLAFMPTGRRDIVEDTLRREMRDLFRTQVGLHLWQFESQGRLKAMVEAVATAVAAPAGREVARLMIDVKPPVAGVQRSFEIDITKEQFRQLDYPDPVEVDVALRIELVDLGLLMSSGVDHDDLDSWARRTVREAITHHLLDVYYVDLFDCFDDKIHDTEEAIRAAARNIGYAPATRLVLQTNLDFDVLQRGFECTIENATFPLASRECEVVLDIETRLRIGDRSVLGTLFKKNTGIRQTVEERIRSTVAAELRKTSPEEFYLRLFGDGSSSEVSVATRLESAIRAACEPFKPDSEPLVHFTPRQDELMKAYQLLVETPLALKGVEDPNTKIIVDVRASVNSISGTHFSQFRKKRPTPERVAETVREHVASFINEYSSLNLRTFVSASSRDVVVHAERWVNERLARDLGLGIAIVHWFRHDESVGRPLRNWENETRDFELILNDLSSQLRNVYVEGDTERVAEIDARKKLVKADLEALYRERGTGSIMTPMDPTFQIGPAPTTRA